MNHPRPLRKKLCLVQLPITIFCLLANVLLAQETKPSSEQWSYTGRKGANNWSHLANEYSPCADGMYQSPIDIRSSDSKKIQHNITFDYHSSKGNFIHNGHTIELVYDSGSHLSFDGKTYELIQFHFHTPAEHLIKEIQHPMELHLVHRSKEVGYLVISLLFKPGNENLFLSSFQQFIPAKPHEENTVEQKINVNELMPERPSFYHYQGSFTTPPCTEGVHWLVVKQSVEASKEQIHAIQKREGKNARPQQKIYTREVDEF